jgi:hypothetical protein
MAMRKLQAPATQVGPQPGAWAQAVVRWAHARIIGFCLDEGCALGGLSALNSLVSGASAATVTRCSQGAQAIRQINREPGSTKVSPAIVTAAKQRCLQAIKRPGF